MPYRLIKDEPVPRALARILAEQIDLALGRLRNPKKADLDRAVHEARKSIKKARAILRLVPLEAKVKRANTLLRDAGRELSRLRDAAALIETVDGLADDSADSADSSLAQKLAELRTALIEKQTETDPREARRRAVAALRRFPKLVEGAWPAEADGFSAIAFGLKRTYRRGRRALAGAKDAPSAENFHQLRKRVKDHWYHLRLLEGVEKAPAKRLKELQEWLGDDHNLAVLREMKTVADCADLRSAIGARQENLRNKAIAAAERIYSERPRDHIAHLRELWERGAKK